MTNLSFSQNAEGAYEASFTSQGSPVAVQISRNTAEMIILYANIGSMGKVPIQAFSKEEAGFNYIFVVHFPANVKITIVSKSQVTSAGYE